MKKRYVLFFLTYFLWSFTVAAQTGSLQIGIKLINELTLYDGLAPGFGGQVVYRIGKHSGLESGLFYQTRYQRFFTTLQIGQTVYYYNTKVAERWLQIPILYRFNSSFLNFVVGPQIDYFVGWKDKSGSGGASVTSYDRSAARVVASGGISKSFKLSETIVIEPEAKFNYMFSQSDGGLQLNISLRKSIR